jgi:hypothetical protein
MQNKDKGKRFKEESDAGGMFFGSGIGAMGLGESLRNAFSKEEIQISAENEEEKE